MVCIKSALDTRNIQPIRGLALRRSARSLQAKTPPTGPDSRSLLLVPVEGLVRD